MNYKKPTKAIITDAGFASRYLPITKTVPKAMLPLGNKPIMQLVVEECAEAGIEEIIIVATPEGKSVYEDYFNNACTKIKKQLHSQNKDDRYAEISKVLDLPKIVVIEQDPAYPYGNGSPIASAKKFINDDEAFVVAYSDDVVYGSSDMKTLIESYEKHPDAKAIIISQEMPREVLNKYGIIKMADEEKMTLDNIVEKPAIEDAPSNLTSYGRYLLTPEVFEHLDPKNTGLDNELWTVDAITKMAKTGNVYVEKTKGTWMTTGDPKNYMFAHLRYTLDNEDYAEELKEFVKNA
ncbi:NTP transferase domain-containing protein [Candidatus Saccharibacteria bacterium]|nr:NTP transferase domain-containing protein [Candidatus Saccharibacteria bacterium]